MPAQDRRAERQKKRLAAADETFEKLSSHRIDPSRIEFVPENEDKLEGGYGEVRPALLCTPLPPVSWFSFIFGPVQRREGVMVAVKKLKLGSTKADFTKFKPAFARELMVWSQLKHPCVAELSGFWADFSTGQAWLISPWAPFGSVRDFVASRDLAIPERISLVYDTADGLEYLHSQSICHGDIKAANVLVSGERRAVLCDLGLARLHDENFSRLESTGAFKGSLRWCSPELFNDQPRSPQSDMWAWAWLVWEIMTGRLPYHEAKADYAILAKIFEAKRPEVDNNVQLADCAELWDLMTKCWQTEPSTRPTSTECRVVIRWMPRCPPLANVGGDDQGKVASLLLALGDTYRRQSRYSKAFSILHEALALYREAGDEFGAAESLFFIADISRLKDRYTEATRVYKEALEIYRKLDNQPRIASCLYFLGDTARQARKPECSGYLEEALEMYQAIDQRDGENFYIPLIADIVRMQRRWEEAFSLLARALIICRESGDQDGVGSCLWSMGDIRRLQHQYDEAITLLEQSLVVYRKIANLDGEGKAIWGIGNIQRVREEFAAAISTLEQSLVIERKNNNQMGISTTLWALSDAHCRMGHVEEAKRLLTEAQTIFAEIGNEAAVSRCAEDLKKMESLAVPGGRKPGEPGVAGPGSEPEGKPLFPEEWGHPLRSRPLPRSSLNTF